MSFEVIQRAISGSGPVTRHQPPVPLGRGHVQFGSRVGPYNCRANGQYATRTLAIHPSGAQGHSTSAGDWVEFATPTSGAELRVYHQLTCSVCKDFLPKWTKMKDALGAMINHEVTLREVDVRENKREAVTMGIRSVPAIFFIFPHPGGSAQSSPLEYRGDRTPASIAAFVTSCKGRTELST